LFANRGEVARNSLMSTVTCSKSQKRLVQNSVRNVRHTSGAPESGETAQSTSAAIDDSSTVKSTVETNSAISSIITFAQISKNRQNRIHARQSRASRSGTRAATLPVASLAATAKRSDWWNAEEAILLSAMNNAKELICLSELSLALCLANTKIAAQTKWTFATALQFIKSKIFAATTPKSPTCVARRAVLKDEPPTRASSRATLMKMFT